MYTHNIVQINSTLKGYGIWDTKDGCFIGFQKADRHTNKKQGPIKSLWKQINHAKSAFKLHTGVSFNDETQTRYIIKGMTW